MTSLFKMKMNVMDFLLGILHLEKLLSKVDAFLCVLNREVEVREDWEALCYLRWKLR